MTKQLTSWSESEAASEKQSQSELRESGGSAKGLQLWLVHQWARGSRVRVCGSGSFGCGSWGR